MIDKLQGLDLLEDTFVILTSDNGPVLNDGYDDDAVRLVGEHRPAGPFRSGKYGIYEGGLRVPFIAHWPKGIPAGSTSPALIDAVDMFGTLAALVRHPLGKGEAVDSFNLLSALLGKSETGRTFVIEDTSTVNSEQSSLGGPADSILALVEGDWKIIKPQGGDPVSFHGNEIGNGRSPHLFNIVRDPGETIDLASAEPERTRVMLEALDAALSSQGTRPGG